MRKKQIVALVIVLVVFFLLVLLEVENIPVGEVENNGLPCENHSVLISLGDWSTKFTYQRCINGSDTFWFSPGSTLLE